MKTAILQMADEGPVVSYALMLQSAGYNVFLPNEALRTELRRIGCNCVLSPRDLTASMGYDPVRLPEASPEAMESIDLYCDVKAHQSYEKVVTRWQNLQGKVLWTRINGGRPEHVIRKDKRGEVIEDCGNEINPPCPIMTANLWYRHCLACTNHGTDDGLRQCPRCGGTGKDLRQYACWPPFVRFEEYLDKQERGYRVPIWRTAYSPPICLIHNVEGWGYGKLLPEMRELGLRVFGCGSPDGLLQHGQVPIMLSEAIAMIHLKSNDAPGYSIYECLAAGCPLICSRRLIWRCKMQDLLEPGVTCLVFDRETHEGLTEEDVRSCTAEIARHLERLRDPVENARLGLAGHARLKEVMWSAERKEDMESLHEFMRGNFG